MSKKLAAKAGMIQVPPASQLPATVRSDAEARQKTAPGTMLHFMTSQSVAMQEAEELRDRLKMFEGASPVRTLDPKTVRASRWANRHEASFATTEFAELKAEIAAAGGNVQPIKVRPVAAQNAVATDGETEGYELVYGHRRHRACLELGIAVNALIEEATDRELFEAMERENRGRASLSAWEQGMMYRRALDEGLYPSMRKLAEAVGVDISLISKSVTLARLPEPVVAAFASPLQKDPDRMLERAKRAKGRGLHPAQVFGLLVEGKEVLNGSTRSSGVELQVGGRRVAVISEDKRGRVVVRFESGVLPQDKRDELTMLLESLLTK
jgi:ParB family transcriptional regulator, chromosome partitioning protein